MGGTRRTATARPTAARMLVPLDFSRGAERALGRAAQSAAAAGCEVHRLHVLAPDTAAAAPDRREYVSSRAGVLIGDVAAERCQAGSQLRCSPIRRATARAAAG